MVHLKKSSPQNGRSARRANGYTVFGSPKKAPPRITEALCQRGGLPSEEDGLQEDEEKEDYREI